MLVYLATQCHVEAANTFTHIRTSKWLQGLFTSETLKCNTRCIIGRFNSIEEGGHVIKPVDVL